MCRNTTEQPIAHSLPTLILTNLINAIAMDGLTQLLGRGEPVEIVELDKSGNVSRTWNHTVDNHVRYFIFACEVSWLT